MELVISFEAPRLTDPAPLRSACLAFPGAAEDFPFGPETSVFRVERKMFALSALEREPLEVNLKCEPALAEALRDAYPAVRPGWHMSKRHWNTVTLDGSIPDETVLAMIEDSYDLVVAALPRGQTPASRLEYPRPPLTRRARLSPRCAGRVPAAPRPRAQLRATFSLPMSLRIGLAALAAACFWASAARAAPVTVVDGDQVRQLDDPFVPPRTETALGPASGGARVRAHSSANGGRAVRRALARARARGAITPADQASYGRIYRQAVAAARRLRGARRTELSYVVRSVERIALAGRLAPSRMRVLFLQVRRNRAYWPSKPFPAVGDQVTFRGSEILFQYFAGRGLQIHPLSNFKKANLLHGACTRGSRPGTPVCGARPPGPRPGTPCRPARLRRLLDELSGLAVQRGRGFIAWEYLFDFGGGSPPWMSGMAQATGIVALARAARLLNRPEYNATAAAALGAFETRSPTGVRTRGPMGGIHYLQYSFAPRLYIFNAFFQSLIGLYDYGRLTKDARATSLFQQAEPEARGELPHSDVGDWTRYSFRGRESTREYHELLREVTQGLGRRIGEPYCATATRYRGYQTEPPVVAFLGPAEGVRKRLTRLGFSLSKLSVVEVRVFKGKRQVFRRLVTLRRGGRAVGWRPRSAGVYRVRIGAKELRTGRSLRGRASATVTVR